jgi:hypothetical protein
MGNAFVDRNSSIPEELAGSSNIKLVYRGYFIGVLCPETQTLWATDWTHSYYTSYRNVTHHIINYLAEQGTIRPVPVKTTKPKKKKVKKDPEKIEFAITIGGDPEFELVDCDGDVLRAGDEYRFEIQDSCGDIGLDGSGDQVELRPSPGIPEVVVDNVRMLLEKFGKEFSYKYRLAASSDEFPCGGHIHIGVRPLPDKAYYEVLSKVLDDFVGYPTKKLNGRCRGEDHSYGNIGDWRNQDYGMEYRTPPSAVWKNPVLTMIVLKLTYNLAAILANNLEIEYTTPITTTELNSIGGLSEGEAILYLEECQKPAPRASECLLAAWGVEVEPLKPPQPKLIISFQEEWNSDVKRSLINYLKKTVTMSKSISITCYGLKESRGDVFTFEIPGKTIIKHPQPGGLDTTHFGFSKKFRRGDIQPSDIRNAANSIATVVMGIQDGTIPLNPRRESEPDEPESTDLGRLARALGITSTTLEF